MDILRARASFAVERQARFEHGDPGLDKKSRDGTDRR
jgi:hypothetical protein